MAVQAVVNCSCLVTEKHDSVARGEMSQKKRKFNGAVPLKIPHDEGAIIARCAQDGFPMNHLGFAEILASQTLMHNARLGSS
ncbi:hypothetical protein D3C80_2138240 [compost metagenome]